MTPFEIAARERANSRKAKGTRALYLADLTKWLVFCELENVDPAKPTLAAATKFKDQLEEKQEPLTVRRTLSALSSMYAYAVAHEVPLASWNPFTATALPRPDGDVYTQTEAISDEDAQKMLAAAAADGSNMAVRDLAVLWILYETGLRRGSVTCLERDDIFQRDGKVIARVVVKGRKRREVALANEAAAALTHWLTIAPEGRFVFSAVHGAEGAFTPSTVNRIVHRWAKRSGVLPLDNAERKRIHPHQFRAAYATAALDAGAPLHEVQAAMHHSDPKTTLRYDRGTRGTGVSATVAEFRKTKEKG